MINDLNTSSTPVASHNLSGWFAVIDFLTGISQRPESIDKVTITRKKGNEWDVNVDASESDYINKKRSRIPRGVGLYDLSW